MLVFRAAKKQNPAGLRWPGSKKLERFLFSRIFNAPAS
jgi:hypothetical protein